MVSWQAIHQRQSMTQPLNTNNVMVNMSKGCGDAELNEKISCFPSQDDDNVCREKIFTHANTLSETIQVLSLPLPHPSKASPKQLCQSRALLFFSAQSMPKLELPEDDQFSDIRILRIRFLAHSDIRMYSNVDDSCIFGL